MTCSPLVDGKLLTNNCTKPRFYSIDTITPHFMEWYTSAEECCKSFVPAARRASANYCIGKDGEIWLNVDEDNRAWTSGNYYNDNRAITIECANYMDSRYGVLPDATWYSLVDLCVDICKRYGYKRLEYRGSANYTNLPSDSMLLTKHMWFQDTNCPGPWLTNNFGRLASIVTERLNGKKPDPKPMPTVFGGAYKCNVGTLNVRTQPNLSGTIVAHYERGDIVVLDDWSEQHDGYGWGRYRGEESGELRYVAIGPDTGKAEPNDYLIKM